MGLPQPPPAPPMELELTIVSAQDLFPAVKRSMRTFAVASAHYPSGRDAKVRTPVDRSGHVDPTWNAKLSMPLDPAALRSETSSISIDIYAARSRFRLGPRKTLLGTARVLLSTVKPTTLLVQFVALQVRRPSLRPHGIVNIGVALVDTCPCTPPPLFVEIDRDAATKEADDKEGRSLKAMERKLEMWKVEVPATEKEEDDEEEETAAESRAEPMTEMDDGKGKQG